MDISFVTRKFQRSIAGLGLATLLATSVMTGTAFGMTFDDVDSDSYALEQIDALSDAGVMTGYEGTNNFGPNDNLTREQAAKILVLGFGFTVDADASVTCAGAYSDWAEGYLATANLYGIMEGDGEGNCNATAYINRADFAKMAISASGLSNDGTMASDWFTDVEAGAYFDSYMGTAYVYGVMSGYAGTDLMGPGDNITREQAAKMVYNAENPVYDPPVVEGDDDDDDDDDDDVTGGGALEVILSSDSPEDYTYFAQGTNAEVASFEVTAADEDVLVTSFSVELASGDADSITALALYNEAGTRISRVDSSIDSDDVASMTMLEGGYVVAAGTSEMFRLMNTFSTTAETSTLYSYAFDSSMIDSDADSVEVENDLVTGIFGLLVEDTGAIALDDDGTPSNPQVGETDAVIASFEIEETSTDKDVSLWSLTLENTGTANLDDALSDITLNWDGEWVADGTQNGDYISFQMDAETAPLIQEGTSESFEVQAKIIGESTSTLIFGFEESLDVMGMDEDDNNVAVTITAFAATTITIEAGNISVVGYDAEADTFRADRDDVELGRFEVTAGTDGIELLTLNVDFDLTNEEDDSSEAWFVSDLFENFKAEVNGTAYSMDLNGADGVGEEYTVDLDKVLTEGTVYEVIITADTLTTTAAAAAATARTDDSVTYDVDAYTNFTVDMALEGLGAVGVTTDGLVMEETVDGTAVDDVTPSTVSFAELDGETAGVAINVVSLSSAKSVVVGTEDVLAMEFEMEEEANVSDLTFTQIAIEETLVATTLVNFDSTEVSQVALYQVNSDDTETLLDSVSGSQLASNTADFDNFDVTIAAGTAETFRVYVDFVDDDTNAAHTFKLAITTYDVEDDENNEVYDADDTSSDGDFNGEGDQPLSARTITLVASGILYVEMNNEDDTYDTANRRWLQMGEDDQGLVALALRSDNEDTTIEEWNLILSTTSSTVLAGDADAVAATGLALQTTVASSLRKTGAAGSGFTAGQDAAYIDVDNGGTITTGDIRVAVGDTVGEGYGYANGTTVAATDLDAVAATALALQTTVASSLRKTAAAGTGFVNGTDAAYIDVDNGGTVTTGDIRLLEGSTAATGLDMVGNISDVFEAVNIYDEDGVLVGTTGVSNETNLIAFDSASTELASVVDTTTTYYITGDLNTYGRNSVGNLYSTANASLSWTVNVDVATGDSSNSGLDENGDADSSEEAGEVVYGSTTSGDRANDDATTFTTASDQFGYIASSIVTVELLDEANGVSLSSDLSTGTMNIAIVGITAGSTGNIESDGTDIKTQLESLAFQVNKNADLVAGTITIDRIGGVDSAVAGAVVLTSDGSTASGGGNTFATTLTNTIMVEFLTLDSAMTTDDEIAPGTTAYYLVQCNVTVLGTGASDDFIELSMEDLTDTVSAQNGNDSNVMWYDNSQTLGGSIKAAVYMGSTVDIDAVRVAELD